MGQYSDTDVRVSIENRVKALEHIIKFLDEKKINWCISCGTLLGCIRGGAFIEWDSDIDIAILGSDISKLPRQVFRGSGFTVRHHWGHTIGIHDETGFHIDLFRFADTGNFYVFKYSHQLYCHKFPKCRMIDAHISGVKVKIPELAEEWLGIHFGNNWRIPNPNYCGSKEQYDWTHRCKV